MFCNNCGTQLPEGTKFCNGCGAPVAPVQPQNPVGGAEPTMFVGNIPQEPAEIPAYQPPMQNFAPQPPVQPEPKKSNTGLIIGAVVAVAVVVVVFCILGFVKPGFLLDKEDTTAGKESTSSLAENEDPTSPSYKPSIDEPSSNPSVPVQPSVDLQDAKDAADKYLGYLAKYDIVSLCNCEILSFKDVEGSYEKALLDAIAAENGTAITPSELYSILSSQSNTTITDMEDFINATVAADSGDSDAISYTINSAKEISKSEADGYIRKTKASIDAFSEYGLDSDNCPWDELEAFVKVDCTVSNDLGSDKTVIILGYIDNDWAVIHMDDGSPSIHLTSIAFLAGMLSY